MANEFKIKNGLITPTFQSTDTTDSSLSTNGAATFAGGVGIAKNLNVGGNLTVTGSFNPASINNAQIGNITPSTGRFTDLTATGVVSFTANTGSTSTTTGTLVVTGGAGVSENLYVGGDGVFGTGLSFTAANSNLQSAGSVNSFFQIAVQNKNAGTLATSDIVAFADNGDDTSGWIDLGITSSAYSDATYSLSGPGDGYLYVNGKTSVVGALVISTYTAKDIIFSTNGGAAANEIGRWKHGEGLTIKPAIQATGIDTGALQVTNGGAYIAGNLYVGGTINLNGVAVQQIGQITTTAAGWNLP